MTANKRFLAEYLAAIHDGDFEDYLPLIKDDYIKSHPLEYPFIDSGEVGSTNHESVIAHIPPSVGAILQDLKRTIENAIQPQKQNWTQDELKQRGVTEEQYTHITLELYEVRETLKNTLGEENEFYTIYSIWETVVLFLLDNELWFDGFHLFSIMESKLQTPYISKFENQIIQQKINHRMGEAQKKLETNNSYSDMLKSLHPDSVIDLVNFFEDSDH